MGVVKDIFTGPKIPKPPPPPDYGAIAKEAEEEQRRKAKKRPGRQSTILTDLSEQEPSTLLGE